MIAAALAIATSPPAHADEEPDETPATPFIVNGDLASIAEYPWYAQVFTTHSSGSRFFCGGTVVAARIVLTAGHCVQDMISIRVIVKSDRLNQGASIAVDRWATYRYDAPNLANDVAVLHLHKATNATPVRIVGPNSDYRWQGDGNLMTVVGMGCTELTYNDCQFSGPSPRLRRAFVESRSDSACATDLAQTFLFDSRSMLCAGQLSDPFGSHTTPNACYGDSGGPLVVAGPGGSPRLVGAVSWGGTFGPEDYCGDYPVAYARLARFRWWLASQGVPIERDPFDPAPPLDVDWSAVPLPGDFNGDGTTDALWFGAGTDTDRIRLGNVHGRFQSGPLVDLTTINPPVVGDWNGDGRDDLLLYEPGATADQILLSTGAGFVPGPGIDLAGTFAVVAGDFNGDGRDDVILDAPGGALDQLRLGTPLGRLGSGPEFSVVTAFTRGIPGDFNRDGVDDVLWFGAGSAPDMMRLGRPSGSFNSGPPIALTTNADPVVADYTGDGRDDIIWFDPDGPDLLREAAGNGSFVTGPEIVVDGGYQPFAGDFDADGVGDVFWYRPGAASDKVWLGNFAF